MYKLLCVILAIAAVINCNTITIVEDTPMASAPGFKTVLTQAGLSYVAQIGVELLEQKLQTMTVPDQSGDAGTPIGQVDWTLTGIKVSQFTVGSSAIKLLPGTGLSLAINQIDVTMASSWWYKKKHWPNVSDHGTADVVVQSTNVVVNLAVTESKGAPHLTVTSDSVNIGNLDIKLHGGASWLYNFFIGILHGQVQNAIQKALSDGITQNIDNGVNIALATFPLISPINHEIEIDFTILSNPTFTADYMSIPQLGEIYLIANPTECPANICPADSIPDTAIDSDYVQMLVGDYVANSACNVFLQEDKLKVTVQDSEIPAWAPIRLNTTYWKYILPTLTALYPNNLMEVFIYSTQVPQVKFTPSGATVMAVGDIDVNIVLANGSIPTAFTLTGWVSADANALLNGQIIYGNLTNVQSNFTLAHSNIGQFDPTVLLDLFNLLMQQGIVPAVNSQLSQGFPLPTVTGVTLISPSITWYSGYLGVSANFNYAPPL